MSFSNRPAASCRTFKALKAAKAANQYNSTLQQLCSFLTELGPQKVITVTEDCDSEATYFNVFYWHRTEEEQKYDPQRH